MSGASKTDKRTRTEDGKLIQYGDVEKLEGKGWYMLGLSSQRLIEPVLHRIAKKVPGIFRENAFEMFVVDARDDLSEL